MLGRMNSSISHESTTDEVFCLATNSLFVYFPRKYETSRKMIFNTFGKMYYASLSYLSLSTFFIFAELYSNSGFANVCRSQKLYGLILTAQRVSTILFGDNEVNAIYSKTISSLF